MDNSSISDVASEDESTYNNHFDHIELNQGLETFARSPGSRQRSHSISSIASSLPSESDSAAESNSPFRPPMDLETPRRPQNWYLRSYEETARRARSLSPIKRGSPSKIKAQSAEPGDYFGDVVLDAVGIPLPESRNHSARTSPDRDVKHDVDKLEAVEEDMDQDGEQETAHDQAPGMQPNFIQFSVSAQVRQRTDQFESMLVWSQHVISTITRSPQSITLSVLVAILSFTLMHLLFRTPEPLSVPDLAKVAWLTKSYEPLIYYSENGQRQIGDLQETSVAVWDLGESMRETNMTSGPIIVQALDDLSDSLRTLAVQLSKFFVNVHGDVDNILMTMEWTKRNLASVSSKQAGIFDNVHGLLSRAGILERHGEPTKLGIAVKDYIGQSHSQRARAALHRAFDEFLNVMEEHINAELGHCTQIFTLFEGIDRQFLNLHRVVIREKDDQERQEGEVLASLWQRVIGGNASRLRKFQKNKDLLSSVKDRTTKNKILLQDYNGRLMELKQNLETLRRRLISPLVRNNDSTTMSLEAQILGLEETYQHLNRVRESQKQRHLEYLYGAERRSIHDSIEIEGR